MSANDDKLMVAARLTPIADLRPNPTNARTHPEDQVAQIAASIREFGFTNPILADMDAGGVIVAGHLRRLADAGYLKVIDMSRPGRFHIEIVHIDTGRASPFSTDPVERRQCTAAVTAALASMEDS